MKTKILDRFQQFMEYLLSLAFIVSAVELIGADGLDNTGLMSIIFGSKITLYIYMVWFFFIGCGLIYAKIKKKKRLHKNMLLAMYLTTIYTSVLSVTVFGFAWTEIIDDLILGGLSAWFWLRWKLKTEYIGYSQFKGEIESLRDDLPPHS